MEENKPDIHTEEQTSETSSPITVPQNITLSDALAGVFTEPGTTFSEVKVSTRSTYWVWPIIILAVISAFASYIVMNDEELSSEIKKMQMDAVKERVEKAVKSGDMTREQADQRIEATKKMSGGTLFVVFGTVGALFSVFIFYFLKTFAFWGAFKIFKGSSTFVNMMNVLGLASIISSVQTIVNTVLEVLTGRLFVNLGLVLMFTEEQLGKNMFKFITNFDLITLWYLAVIAVGSAKISGLKSSVTFPVVYGLWIIWVFLTSFVITSFVGM